MDPNSETFNNIALGLPQDATLLFHNTTLQYENGELAAQSNGVYNHHVAFVNLNKPTSLFAGCPAGSAAALPKMPSTMMGASEEIGSSAYSTPDGKFNSGYYISKTDKIVMSGEIVNYTNDTKVIYAISDMEYVPGRPKDSLDVVVQVMSVNQCDTNNIMLHAPEGKKKFSFESKNMTVLADGYILSRRVSLRTLSCRLAMLMRTQAHLHDGGVNMDFKLNGKTICDSRAVYGGKSGTLKGADGSVWETVSSTGECHDPIKASKGDVVTLQANYDLETHPP
jgi:hypothetical protein